MEINKNIKRVLIGFTLGFCSLQAQEKDFSSLDLDTMSLLIGMFNDYGGRTYVPNHPTYKYLITDFYNGQTEALNQFSKHLKNSGLDINHFNIFNENDSIINPMTFILSEKYHQLFHSYYIYKKANFLHTDEHDNEYIFYWGRLKRSKFKTRKQKLMFLKGAFIREGRVNQKGQYQYRLANSGTKITMIRKFLRQTGSKIIEYKIAENNTPTGQTITFEPSDELKNLLIGDY
ncbi:hypothetical protein J8281_16760 [Aquimarina sp. U1-2]|uniref:hypothetical protein n=1 Tax=Aquimarina sp. U1-2 TaxID=2823141 RepID=UPI001AEC9856|nr:hypothetical protein [Aquimarina sp. U1-2]MBP2833849.1 hypothetical protein [Aquimarina sp. U1-2]